MNWQPKKIISVIFAILIGAGIIFFAWESGNVSYIKNPEASNNNAWKDSLSVVPAASSTANIINSSKNQINFTATDASSATAIIASKLLDNYATIQGALSTTTMSDSDANAFAENLLSSTPRTDSSIKQYTEQDLSIIEDSTIAINLYKTEVAQALNVLFSQNTFDELAILNKAIDTRDSTTLAPLAKAVTNYQNFINTLLSIKVPRSEVNLHLYLLQSYATILSGVIDMQKILSDPVVGFQGLAKYNSGVTMVSQTGVLFGQKK